MAQDSIYSIVKPIQFYSKIFAITSFSLKETSDQKLQPFLRVSDIIVLIIYVLYNFLIWGVYLFNNQSHSEQPTVSEIFNSMMPISLIICTNAVLSSILATFFYRKKITQSLNLLVQFDEKVIKSVSRKKSIFWNHFLFSDP